MSSKLHESFLNSLDLRMLDRAHRRNLRPPPAGSVVHDKLPDELDPFDRDAPDNIRLAIASVPPLATDRWENEGGALRHGTLLRFRRFRPKTGETHA